MKLLLDTHIFLWFMNGSSELPVKMIKIIPFDFSEIQRFAENNKFEILPISFDDTKVVRDLAFHHRDPFDRIIIAQSITNKLTIITADNNFRKYESEVLWK